MNPGETPRTPSSADGRTPGAPPPPVIPDYELLRCVGRGSYGEVWLALNLLGSFCAVKVVRHHPSPEEDRPYAREFEGIRRFEPVSKSHPSQISISHVGRDAAGAFFYYVMELGDDQDTGQQIDPEHYQPKTLRSELKRRGRLPPDECLELMLALAQALEHLHSHDLIHRDIKPANVIFVHGRPKLADIGLVAGSDQEHSFVGTEGYVPGEGPGKPADIYALGKVLYEINTGLARDQYPSLPDESKKTPEPLAVELNQVVNRACDPSVQRRYQSAAEMREELEFLKSKKSLVLQRRLERWRKRFFATLAISSGAVALTLLVAGVLHFKGRAAEQARQSELREIRFQRTAFQREGWFDEYWERLKGPAAIRMDEDVMQQASAMLAGLDAGVVAQHTNFATFAAAFGPDGRAVICGLNRPALMMDTNGAVTELPARGKGPVGWAADGAPLLFTAESNRFVLYHAETGEVRREFPPPACTPGDLSETVLALAPDGRRVAAGWLDQVCVWDADNGELDGAIAVNATALAFSPDGLLLGIGTTNGSTLVYSVPALARTHFLKPGVPPNSVQCLAFARDPTVPYPDGQGTNAWLLAVADRGAQVVIWDLQREVARTRLFGGTWVVNSIAFHPGGLFLAAVGQGQGKIWDVASGAGALRLAITGAERAHFVTFDSSGERLLCGGEQGEYPPWLSLCKLEFHRGIHALRGLTQAARRVWFSPDSRRVAAIADNWELGVWDVTTDQLLYRFETPHGVTADSAGGCFSADGEQFWFATRQEVCHFDLTTGAIRQRWPVPPGFCEQLQFDPQGRLHLLRREADSTSANHVWRLYQLTEAGGSSLVHEQLDRTWSARWMAMLPGGAHFLVWNGWPWESNQVLRAYSTASGAELWRTNTGIVKGDLDILTEPNGRWFAYQVSADAKPFRQVSLPDFNRMGQTALHCQALGPSGQQFVGAGTWRVLDGPDARDGLPVDTDWWEQNYVSAFSRDGRRLAIGTEEGVVLVAEIETVRARMEHLQESKSVR